jgi:hypothetical protein
MSFSRNLRKECEFLDDISHTVDAELKRCCTEASQIFLEDHWNKVKPNPHLLHQHPMLPRAGIRIPECHDVYLNVCNSAVT